MSGTVRVTRAVLKALVAESRLEPGFECCGLLAGRGGLITTVMSAQNALASATAFDIAPAELFALFQRMREQGLDHLGIYHSHPAGENAPSRRDIAAAYYPDAAYFIISPMTGAAKAVRVFSIRNERAEELEIEVVEC
jgi:[CysO sulfur-carrier protein]-S-L-cysteine hydrolase